MFSFSLIVNEKQLSSICTSMYKLWTFTFQQIPCGYFNMLPLNQKIRKIVKINPNCLWIYVNFFVVNITTFSIFLVIHLFLKIKKDRSFLCISKKVFLGSFFFLLAFDFFFYTRSWDSNFRLFSFLLGSSYPIASQSFDKFSFFLFAASF